MTIRQVRNYERGRLRIDLHCHTACSDGTDTPAELMQKAADAGLDVVAITDHDTTAGWTEATSNLPAGLTLISGAEFSTQVLGPDQRLKSVHLLGYLFDPADAAIVDEQLRLRNNRETRGLAIVDLLVEAGVGISRRQVLDTAADAPVGRPHIARTLLDAGVVDSIKEAFDDYLERPEFKVIKPNTDLDLAITMIKAAGGVAVLAHPWARGGRDYMTASKLRALQEAGLDGIEVNHPDHDAKTRRELSVVAEDLDLIMTGSSDYHGNNKTLRIGQETTSEKPFDRITSASSGITRPIVA